MKLGAAIRVLQQIEDTARAQASNHRRLFEAIPVMDDLSRLAIHLQYVCKEHQELVKADTANMLCRVLQALNEGA